MRNLTLIEKKGSQKNKIANHFFFVFSEHNFNELVVDVGFESSFRAHTNGVSFILDISINQVISLYERDHKKKFKYC